MYLISEGRKSVWREFYDTGISGGKPPSDAIKSAFAQAKGFLHYELRITNYELEYNFVGAGSPRPVWPAKLRKTLSGGETPPLRKIYKASEDINQRTVEDACPYEKPFGLINNYALRIKI